MLRKICAVFFLVLCLGITPCTFADSCLPKHSKKDTVILLLPLTASKNTPSDSSITPTLVIPTLLQEYLNHVDGLAPVFSAGPAILDPKKAIQTGQEASAAYVLAGSFERKSSAYHLTAHLYPTAGDMKKAVIFSSSFEFPGGTNDLLIALTEKIATSVGKKYQEKKVLPYLNRSSSAEAYLSYAEGRRHLPMSPDRAIGFFKKAVEKDYNYVPAYLGVAEALARAGAKGHAYRELTKAKLLNPVLTKEKEKCIESLL